LIEGDRVLTSGDGGVVPRGLSVGTVARGLDGSWRVVLDSDAGPMDFVRILKFTDFSQLARPQELAPSAMPTTKTDTPEAPVSIATAKAPNKETVPQPAKAKAP
jgi:rod shape-determining protein MreC